jgi:peptidoglycan/xylan/chitin deacetylase (PgdA/CDA1 family)
MRVLLIMLMISTQVHASWWHLPDNRQYRTGVDTGYTQYNTPSLHYTGQYILTFDDGPHPINTPIILDTLKKYNMKATFFILTKNLTAKTLPIFKRILDEGHIAASHDHIHNHNNRIDRKTFKANLKKSFLKLSEYFKLAGHELTMPYFRFPYAEYGRHPNYHHMNVIKEVSQELFGDNCIHFVFWDIDSGDWIPGLTQKELLQNITVNQHGGEYTTYRLARQNGRRVILKKKAYLENPTQGGVVLFHDIQKRTIRALDSILNFFKTNELPILPLSDAQEFSYQGLDCRMQ